MWRRNAVAWLRYYCVLVDIIILLKVASCSHGLKGVILSNGNLGSEFSIRQSQVQYAQVESESKTPSIIGESDTIDAWRHERQYAHLSTIIRLDPDANWLTVGDSGADAFWLRQQGVEDVTASSLSDLQLQTLQRQGFLDGVKCLALDGQNIDLPADSVDYVVCKEAYHHFEKPALGIYEMLRVARKGIVLLCEPYSVDGFYPLDALKRQLKVILRRNTNHVNPEFEAAGNYVYGLSLSETRKIATALQLRPMFHRFISDFWVPRLVKRRKDDAMGRFAMSVAIGTQDMLAAGHLTRWGKITVVLFKSQPDAAMVDALRADHFQQAEIPVNPYLSSH